MWYRPFLEKNRESNTKEVINELISRNILWWREREFFVFPHCCVTQCGNYVNLLSHFFAKNFVKTTFLLMNLLNSWFDEIFFRWEIISCFSTLCVTYSVEITATILSQKLREMTVFTKELYSKLIWRKNKNCVAVNFSLFHSV